jgi:ribosomal-protein-alanine N-acetyltransferase
MAFLSSLVEPSGVPMLSGSRIYLRTPQMNDYAQWSSLREASRAFLVPWEPLWAYDDLTRHAYRARMKRYGKDILDDVAYPFFLFLNDGSRLAGGLTLSNVRRGVAQTATMGYWMGEPYVRRGYMTDALKLAIAFAFGHLGLHRLEAACLPRNVASIALLRTCGFAEEGYARRYLRINGEWQDHLLFAMLAEDRKS